MKQRETDLKFLAIGIVLSIIMSIFFITTVMKNTQHTTYGDSYKSVNELRNNLTYDIVLPSFVDSEDNLKIGNVSGGVFTISNDKFRLCGCEYTEIFKKDDKFFRLCPLGFYEKIEDDRLYNVNSDDENFSLLRIRQAEDFTIFNYLYADVAYGCVVFEKITDEKILALVNLKEDNLDEMQIISKDDAFEQYGVISIEDTALKTLLDKNEHVYKSGSIEDLEYYSLDNKLILMVAENNFNIYIKEYQESYKFMMVDNQLWLYNPNLEKEFNEDSLNYYRQFLSTIESILEAYD